MTKKSKAFRNHAHVDHESSHTGLEGRGILGNIFLDGTTFSDRHSVDKEYFVADLQASLTFQWDYLSLRYTQIFHTGEYKSQDRSDVFGSLSISYQF